MTERRDQPALGKMGAFARDLERQNSLGDVRQLVVDTAVELIEGSQAASISLAARDGRIETSASTSADLSRADELQAELNEGPCVDAIWEHDVVRVADLRQEDRWPRWAPLTAEELGFRSMMCVRLFTHDSRIGALNLFSRRSESFSEEDLESAVAIAAHAAIAVTAGQDVANLQAALVTRTLTAQATGLIMAYYELDAVRAFQVLKRLSSHTNTKLSSVARDIVERHNADPSGAPIRED